MLCAWWPTLLHGVTYVIILATKSFSGYHESIPDTLILTIMRAFFLTIKESEKTIQCKEAVKFVKPEFCLVLSQHYHSTSPAENIFRVPTTPGQNIFRMVFTFFCSDQDCPINDIIRSYLRPTQMILLFTVRVNT